MLHIVDNGVIMSYKEKYKSIQLNLSRKKYSNIIEWLDNKKKNDCVSINSFILKLLKREFENEKNTKKDL